MSIALTHQLFELLRILWKDKIHILRRFKIHILLAISFIIFIYANQGIAIGNIYITNNNYNL